MTCFFVGGLFADVRSTHMLSSVSHMSWAFAYTHAYIPPMATGAIATLLTSMIIVQNAGTATVNGQYFPQDSSKIPNGFDLVCKQNNWNTLELWKKLNGNSVWYEKKDGAYVYYNHGDRRWWIDDKDGLGVYIADTDGSDDAIKYPLRSGYQPLQNAQLPAPTIEIKSGEKWKDSL